MNDTVNKDTEKATEEYKPSAALQAAAWMQKSLMRPKLVIWSFLFGCTYTLVLAYINPWINLTVSLHLIDKAIEATVRGVLFDHTLLPEPVYLPTQLQEWVVVTFYGPAFNWITGRTIEKWRKKEV